MKRRQPDLDLWQLPPGTKSTLKSIDSYRKRGLERDIPQYTQRCLEAEWEIYKFDDGSKAVELECEFTLGDIPIRCSIDRVQWWPHSKLQYATIEDLKSGTVEHDELDRRQLGLYAYAARQLGIPLKYGRYWFTKLDRGSEWFDLSRYDYDYLTETYTTLDTAIGKKIFLPNPGKHCTFCSVAPYCPEQGNKKVG